jgi:hypothetical protein
VSQTHADNNLQRSRARLLIVDPCTATTGQPPIATVAMKPVASSLGYRIAQNGAFSWTGPSTLTPEEAHQINRP